MATKTLPVQQLVDFRIMDDHIVSKGQTFYFYRYFPPNMDILTDDEVRDEIAKLSTTLDTLSRNLSLFITDKLEDLSQIKEYYNSLPPEHEDIISEIVYRIESIEVESTSVQRAFYFVYTPEKDGDDIYNIMRGHGYKIERAQKQELAVLLRNYMVREFTNADIYTIEQEVATTPKNKKVKQSVFNREVLRRLMPNRIDFNIFHAEQSGCLRKTIMIKNFPSEIPPKAFMRLASLRGTTFNMRLKPMDKGVARKMTDQQIKNKRVMASRSSTTGQIESQLEQNIITEFYANLARNQNTIYQINVFIEMYGKNREALRKVEERVHSELAGLAVTYDELKYEQREAFASVQPLGRDLFLPMSNNLPSTTIGALYPCSYSCRLDPMGMLLGQTIQGGNMFLDIWQRDSNTTNSNFTVTGTSGQGKSWLIKKMIVQQFIRGTTCFIFDPENEYVELTKALKGTVLNCSDGTVKMNPFEMRTLKTNIDMEDDFADDLGAKANMPVFYQHLSWLADFFTVLFPALSPMAQNALMVLVQDMYITNGINETTNFDAMGSQDYPTFTTLWEFITRMEPEKAKQYAALMSGDMLRDIRLCLKDCYDGPLGAILNGHTNIKNDRLICFSMADLMEGSTERMQAVLFNVTSYVWNIISKRQNNVMLNIDELYLYLENLTMVKYLRSFVKRSRKYNASLGIGTQQLADCLQPDIVFYTTAIFNNAAFKFMFYPEKIDLDLMKEKLKLSDGEVKCIAQSNRRHTLVKAGNDKYYMEVGTLDYEPMMFGTAGGE